MDFDCQYPHCTAVAVDIGSFAGVALVGVYPQWCLMIHAKVILGHKCAGRASMRIWSDRWWSGTVYGLM